MTKSAISDEMRIDMKLLCAIGSSGIAASMVFSKKGENEGRKIHLRSIQRQITKFERELTLRRKATGGSAKTALPEKKTAVTENNIRKQLLLRITSENSCY
jgi:anti-anti-sigma regulatory factor